jgi:organic hydroperoxide reductase OsmC/OhrA
MVHAHIVHQLFAMGYAACFLVAIQAVSRKGGKEAQNATVRTSVHIGKPKDGQGFGLAVDITVNGVDDQKLVNEAHEVSSMRSIGEKGQTNDGADVPI